MLKILVLTVARLSLGRREPHAQRRAARSQRSWKCAGSTPMNPLPVGDAADHIYGVQQTKCTAVSGELAGLKQTEGVPTEFVEATGASSKGHGIFVETMSTGDKIAPQGYRLHRNLQEQDDGHRQQQVHGHERHRPIQRHDRRRDLQRQKAILTGSAEFTCSGNVLTGQVSDAWRRGWLRRCGARPRCRRREDLPHSTVGELRDWGPSMQPPESGRPRREERRGRGTPVEKCRDANPGRRSALSHGGILEPARPRGQRLRQGPGTKPPVLP